MSIAEAARAGDIIRGREGKMATAIDVSGYSRFFRRGGEGISGGGQAIGKCGWRIGGRPGVFDLPIWRLRQRGWFNLAANL